MIPLKLTLEGLYSYQQRQEIDFRRLTQAELFGIFGATGSGKSSILEAISFALYGRTERLGAKEPGGTAYHMMNLKSDRLFIDFEFAGGKGESERYRFTVENRRHGTDFERTRSFTRKAYSWVDETWFPLEENTAEAVIGLSYDHFKRTIIIPQGKFEDFIQLTPRDRSQMLQEIFGLEKFELSGKVKSLIQRNLVDLESTERQLLQYEAVTPAAIAENDAALAALEANRTQLDATLKGRYKQREALEQLQERFARIAQQEERLASLRDKQPAYAQRQAQLDRYVEAQTSFGILLNNQRQWDQQARELDKRLQEKRDTAARVEAELGRKQQVFQEVAAQYQERDSLLREAEELETILKLQELAQNIEALEGREAKGKARLEAAEAARQELEAQVIAGEAELVQLDKQRPDMAVLMAIQQWYGTRQGLAKEVTHWEQQLAAYREEVAQGREDKERLTRLLGWDLKQYDHPTAKLIERLRQQEAELLATRQELTAEQDNLRLRQRLHELAGDLEAGTPCPLCGATDHPGARHTGGADEDLRRKTRDLERLEARLDVTRQALPELEGLLRRAQKLQPALVQAEQGLQAAQKALDLHQAQFVWEAYRREGEAAIATRLAEAQALDEAIKARKQALQSLRERQRQEAQHLRDWQPTLDQIRQGLHAERGRFHSLQGSLRRVAYADWAAKPPLQVQAQADQCRASYESIGSMHQTLAGEIEARKTRLATLQGEIGSLEQDRRQATTELAAITRKLEEKLAESRAFESLAAVRATLDLALQIDVEREAVREFDRQLTEAETTLRDLREQVGDQAFDPAAYEALRTEIAGLEAQQAQLTEQIGGKVEVGRRLRQDLAQKEALAARLAEITYRAENLRTLERLFRGSGFVNYISTAYLENLCAAANERFLKLSSNALSLEVDEENNFHVRDLLNGGRRRSIKTLSGGQTFQAALCLALALSDQVQQQVQAEQNFFFLDEGFGSQDKQALQTIFQTLKSLRREHRIVGVISHVEELQQEIQTYLHIHHDPERGSLARGSWQA